MMTALRQMWRMMRSAPTGALFRRYSAAGDIGSGSGGSAVDEAHNPDFCYALGKFGKICFDRSKFIPLDDFILEFPPFVPVPRDRLINGVNPWQPLLTSELGKQWIRSGFLAAHFAKNLGMSFEGAFTTGNVGVIADLNLIVFLHLHTTPSSKRENQRFPMTFPGFSDFLYASIERVLGANCNHILPGGFQELRKLAARPETHPCLIIYHPELMSLEVLYVLFLEAFRVLRRQMPAQGQSEAALDAIQALDGMLGSDYCRLCHEDTMVQCWLGVHRARGSGLPGIVGLPGAATGSDLKMNPMALEKTEWQKLKTLVKKLYRSGGMQTGAGNSPTSIVTTYTTPTGKIIAKDPKEAIVLDVHRHCIAHVVEEESILYSTRLPHDHQMSFSFKPMEWRDGVQLLLHRFPRYSHCVVVLFHRHKFWERLGLEERFPIPNVFYTPSLDEKSKEC